MRPAHGSDILLLFQAVFGCPLRYGEVFIPGARRSDLIEPLFELSAISRQLSAIRSQLLVPMLHLIDCYTFKRYP